MRLVFPAETVLPPHVGKTALGGVAAVRVFEVEKLAALAVYCEGIAKTTDVPSVARRAKEEVAEFQREHDALAAQLAAKQPVSASPP